MHRRENIFLVEIDDMYALVDHGSQRVHVINRPAAYAWSHLEHGGVSQRFISELEAYDLLSPQPARSRVDLVVPDAPGEPRIISSAPIQVAAGSGQGQFQEAGESPDPFTFEW